MNFETSTEESRVSVKVSKVESETLRKNLDQFNAIFQKQQDSFNTSNQTLYYIVSTKYIEQWRQYCSAGDLQRFEPIPMNEELMDQGGGQLKVGLTEKVDFEIVNQKIYNLIKLGTGFQLSRRAYMQGVEKKVPVYSKPFNYVLIINQDLKEIDFKRKSQNDFSMKEVIGLSQQSTVADLLNEIEKAEKLSSGKKIRVWKNPKETTIEKLVKEIAEKTRPLHYQYRISGIGILIEEEERKVEDIKYEEGDYFIVECIERLADWFFRSPDEKKCEGCYKMRKLPFECGCKKVAYCSESCQENDKRYHLRLCTYAQEQELNRKIQMTMTSKSSRGLVGLSNLGNTCFMNSCLQCLSHTLPLTEYFLESHYEKEINKENPLGCKGKLAKSYAKFIYHTWCQSDSTFSPYNLKGAVSSVNQIFSGYAQHDSQEFLTFLVDGIHEDLNRVKKKPYVESVDSKGREEQVVAKESWLAHIKRNQSIIVDLMTGQYRSKVVCPDCDKQSITFDPFTTVTLPIPEQAVPGVLKYYVLFSDNQQSTKKMSFQYKKAQPEQWTKKAAENLERKAENFQLYVLSMHQEIHNFNSTSKSQIMNKIQVENKSVFLIQKNQEERQIVDPLQLVFCLSKKAYYSEQYDSLWFKRPFWFMKENLRGMDLLKRVLKYLYHDTYDHSKKRSNFDEKTYNEYMQIMIKNRPCKLVLKFGKKYEHYYHRRDVVFKEEIAIEDDTDILKLLEKVELNDCEIDVRFTKDAFRDFSFERLKKYEDKTQFYSSKHSQSATVTLDQCFEVLEYPEKLEKGNEWYCPNCKDHKLATKQLTIYKAPDIMVLHLKRFKNKGILRKQKNEANVLFPESLDMSKYIIDPKPMSSYISMSEEEGCFIAPPTPSRTPTGANPIYDLYAISNHYGGLGGGHYTAYAKNDSKWYQFNDSSVHGVSTQSMKGSGAYMLFYRRRI